MSRFGALLKRSNFEENGLDVTSVMLSKYLYGILKVECGKISQRLAVGNKCVDYCKAGVDDSSP